MRKNVKFMVKLTVKFLLLMLIVTFSTATVNVLNSMEVIISNNVALGQMSNSDEAFVLMEFYSGLVRPLTLSVTVLFVAAFSVWMSSDIYKFLKNKGEKNEKQS